MNQLDVTYRHVPDLHAVSVANHEAEGGVSSAAVHLHKLWVARRVYAERKHSSTTAKHLRSTKSVVKRTTKHSHHILVADLEYGERHNAIGLLCSGS